MLLPRPFAFKQDWRPLRRSVESQARGCTTRRGRPGGARVRARSPDTLTRVPLLTPCLRRSFASGAWLRFGCTMKKPHYSYPILDDPDILVILRELGMNASETDLINPTPQTVHMFYCHFLDILMNVTREDLIQPQFTSTLEHPELHEDSIPMATFLRSWCVRLRRYACSRRLLGRGARLARRSRCMTVCIMPCRDLRPAPPPSGSRARSHKLMRTVGITDFTIKDVLYPERARLRRNFSAVINFAKFREDRMERYQQFTNESAGFVAQKAHLEAENNKLLAEIRAINAQRAAEEPRVAELEAQNAQYVVEISTLNQQQAQMKEVAQGLKHNWQEIGDQNSETKYSLLSAKQELESLRAQIVPSPEKLKQVRLGMRWRVGRTRGSRARHSSESFARTPATLAAPLPRAGADEPGRVDQAREGEHWRAAREAAQAGAQIRVDLARGARRQQGAAARG